MKKINVCKPFPADTSKKSDLLKTYNDSQNPIICIKIPGIKVLSILLTQVIRILCLEAYRNDSVIYPSSYLYPFNSPLPILLPFTFPSIV